MSIKTADLIYDNGNSNLQEFFWGIVPQTIGDALVQSNKKILPSINENLLNNLKKVLYKYHDNLGILTNKVEENLSKMENGVIVTGQQPAPFGGKGLVGNKIATALKLALLSENHPKLKNSFVPVFYIADYDSIQPEITNTHFPNPSSAKATAISILTEDLEGRAANILKLPGFSWLRSHNEEIKNLYSEYLAETPPTVKKLLDTRLNWLQSLLSITYLSSKTLTDWFVKIWGTICNINNDFGIIFLPMSNPEVRDLVIKGKGYEKLITVRKTFIDHFNQVTRKLQEMNIKPAVGERADNYLPFFYECDNDSYRVTVGLDQGYIHGRCPICNTHYQIPIDEKNPNLYEIRRKISPRVDSSHLIAQYLFPIKIRVSGPGEISYFAQVYPAAVASGIEMSIFLKYTRMFYNAPWLENLGKTIAEKNLPSLHSREFFKTFSGWVKAKRKGETEKLYQQVERLSKLIKSVYTQLQPISDQDVEKYLSWQFGVFGTGNFGQEVSWNWIDLAINSGVDDYLQTYMRYYENETPISGYFFLNTLTR